MGLVGSGSKSSTVVAPYCAAFCLLYSIRACGCGRICGCVSNGGGVSGGGFGGLGGLGGIDTDLEEKAFALVEKFEKNLISAMSVEGDPIGFAQSTKMDGVNIKPVDLSVQAIQQGTSGIQDRINSGRIIQSLNDLDSAGKTQLKIWRTRINQNSRDASIKFLDF